MSFAILSYLVYQIHIRAICTHRDGATGSLEFDIVERVESGRFVVLLIMVRWCEQEDSKPKS